MNGRPPSLSDVTPCLVTRGDVPLDSILAELDRAGYAPPIVWDNSVRPDRKVSGRYHAAYLAPTPLVYWQDDDVVFRHHDELLAQWEPGVLAAVWAHGANPAGYDDVALVGAGAICEVSLMRDTWQTYAASGERAASSSVQGFAYEADFVFGTLVKHARQIVLPYERLYEGDPTRLCEQPWQESLKATWTEIARSIRDESGQTTIREVCDVGERFAERWAL